MKEQPQKPKRPELEQYECGYGACRYEAYPEHAVDEYISHLESENQRLQEKVAELGRGFVFLRGVVEDLARSSNSKRISDYAGKMLESVHHIEVK